MTNLLNESNIILDSFVTGQGKTNDETINFKVSEKLIIDGLNIRLLGKSFNFTSDAHKLAFDRALYYKTFKDLSIDQIDKLFNHLSSGEYISLNHTNKVKDVLPDYTELFSSINYTGFKRVSTKSKLYILEFEVNTDNVFLLISEGFKIHSPILNDNYTTVGFNIELPPKKD